MNLRALLLFVLAGGALPASAAIRCVNPAGSGGCSRTIQAALDRAAPNDTINIGAGTYFENVAVGQPGIKLVGASKLGTILDASSNSALPVALVGPAIRVFSQGVVIRNLTIRNGATDAIHVFADGTNIQGVLFQGSGCNGVHVFSVSGTQILGNEFRSMGCRAVLADPPSSTTVVKLNTLYGSGVASTATSRVGFEIVGDDALVSNNKAYRCGNDCFAIAGASPVVQFNSVLGAEGGGIDVGGVGALITNNHISDTAFEAIFVNGANAAVKLNVIANVDDDGIHVSGDGAAVSSNTVTNTLGGRAIVVFGASATVSSNRITHAASTGISVGGAGAAVTSNLVTGSTDEGLFVSGTNPKVELNKVAAVTGAGLDVACTPGCTAGSIARNTVTDTFDDGFGLVLGSDAAGMTVSDNTVTRSTGASYDIGGSGITLVHNVALDQGGGGNTLACFLVGGAGGHSLSFNTATRCANNGFRVTSSSNGLTSNLASFNASNGFEINTAADAGSNTLVSNTSSGNSGAGFAVIGSTDNFFQGNVAIAGNRTGFCDDGARTGLFENTFASSAPACDIRR